jgi:hypothetical protein
MTWIGTLGLNTFNNEIEDINNTLVNRIVSDINDTSNYVLATSNIFVKEITHTSNYVWITKNIFVKEIEHTSNYVLSTSNILEKRIKALEGSEGTPGDVNLGIPSIPSTGGVAVAAAIATITAACIAANGITVLTLLDILEDKVDLNKTQADKIGGWSSNYTDKLGIFGSNYTDLQVIYTSNYTDKLGIFGSNYTDLQVKYTSNYIDKLGIFGSNYTDRVCIFGSNYTDLQGQYTSNYTDRVGIFGSNYTDLQVIYTSNYTDKLGTFGSNYTDLQVIYTSNYTDKLGIFGSNYTDLQVIYTSNYTDKLGIFGSNYTDLQGQYTSNYIDKLGIFGSNYTDKIGIYGSNYTDRVGIFGSNYTDLQVKYSSNYIDKSGIFGSNYTDREGIFGSNYTERLTTALGVRVDNTSNYVARIITELTTDTPALGVRVDNTSNYVASVNTELTTSDTALGLRVDNTSNYVERINTELNTSSTALGVRVDNTSNYVARINTELNTTMSVADTALGVRVDNTSNYVARINTELNTSDTELGVRVDNTSNYVATKQNTLTTNTLLSGFFNTTDFVNVNDKIRLNKSVEPIGYYQINIFPPGNLTWTSVFYNYSDRGTPYNNNNIYYSDGEGSVPYKYTLSGGGIRNSRIYYNNGDKIMFKNWVNGAVDVNQYGISHLYRLYKMRADFEDGWGAIGNVPIPYTPADTGYYKQFTWNGGINEITDWRERSAWENTIPHPSTPLPGYPSIGAYNDQLAYTLQSGWKYMLCRMVNGTFCDTPLIIHVNDPYYYPELSYIPPPTTLSALQPVRNKRSIPLSKQVGSYDPTPNTETTSDVSLDYELTTGFNYDETSNLISVFDGNYNNLTNKPSLITTTDINHTSNYVSRINTDLTTAIGGKAPTSHTHTIANITDLQTTLDGKAPTSHTHTIANITDLQTTLDGKAPTSHTHTIANITNLQTTLDGKAPTSHTHTIANITDLQTTLDAKQATLTAGTGISIVSNTISATTSAPTSATLIGILNTAQFVNNTGTSKIDILSTWKPSGSVLADTTTILATTRQIAGVDFNGSSDISIPYANLTNRPWINPSVYVTNPFVYTTRFVKIGNTTEPVYPLDVIGDINVSGAFRINGTALSTGSKWTTATDTTRIYYNAGNVGIGTINPTTTLDVVNSSPIITIRDTGNGGGKIYFGNSSHGVGRNPNISTLTAGNDVALWTAGDGSVGFITNSLERMRIKSDGNVGIGTNNPTYRTHLRCNYDQVASGLHLDASDSTQYTLTIWPYVVGEGAVGWRFRTISAYSGGTNTPLEFSHNGTVSINNNNVNNGAAKLLVSGNDGNNCSALFYHTNRSQGIGIVYDGFRGLAPSGNQDIVMRPLGTGMFIVEAGSGSTGNRNLRYFNYDTAPQASYTSINDLCAKFNSSIWVVSWISSSSDSRIKEDIHDINDDDALNKLLAIEPKTYKYIDKIAKGDKKVYGFIAQQVREVIPEAVKIEKAYIPNIMLTGDFADYIITLPSQPTKVIIKVNDNIKCYDDKGEVVLVKVEEVIDEITFKIKAIDDMKPLEYTHDKIYIHGTEVEDFHTLSKEYIFTLNVCATQELHRRIKSQEERIKELELKMTDILKYLSL